MRAVATFTAFVPILALLLGFAQAITVSNDPWDHAPDFSKDPFPPYPPLKNPDGSNITIENLRGTRLFGWKGCSSSDSKAIAEAFDDFHKLADPLASNLDWSAEPAADFWGRNNGPNRVPDERRTQIQRE